MWAGELLVEMGAFGYYSSNWSRPVLSECEQVGECAGRILADRSCLARTAGVSAGWRIAGDSMCPELQKTQLAISRMDFTSDLKTIHLRRVAKRGESSDTSLDFRIATGLPDELSKHSSTVLQSLPTKTAWMRHTR